MGGMLHGCIEVDTVVLWSVAVGKTVAATTTVTLAVVIVMLRCATSLMDLANSEMNFLL